MKQFLLFILLVSVCDVAHGQYAAGRVSYQYIPAPSLQLDDEELPTRRVTIYLPPQYDASTDRFPVVYYLHGFTWSDSLQIAEDHFDKLLDKAIGTGIIEPLIVVMPDHHTEYRGSFYTNSTLTGNWADFTATDVVAYVDQHYRTIPDRESRGVAGHSMGGHGAIKLGMLFPEVFSVVYALSPAMLGLAKEVGPKGAAYRRVNEIPSQEELVTGYANFMENGLIAAGRAFSPNPNAPPFFADLPFSYKGDRLVTHYDVLALWHENLPLEMVDDHVDALNQLTALKLDWGRNEEFAHIPVTSRMFSQKLENLGIEHYAEEYIGTHGNKLWTDDGRALNDMLPFCDRYLQFE